MDFAIEVERIQSQAIRAIGHDPREAAALIQQERPQDPQQLERDINAETIQFMLPEFLYADVTEIRRDLARAGHTSLDRGIVLHRTVNIVRLAHQYFAEAGHAQQHDISISTLPFSHVNGVAYVPESNKNILFIDEGLLLIAPELIFYSLPLFDVNHFGQAWYRLGDDLEMRVKSLETKLVLPFFQKLALALSGWLTPMTLEAEFSHVFRGGAFEKWRFTQILRSQIRESLATGNVNGEENAIGKEIREHATHENRDADDLKMKMRYYAMRGMYTFVIGHEFSHFYNRHHDARNSQVPIRPEAEIMRTIERARSYLEDSTLPTEGFLTPNYLISQPTESQADADGLHCVAKYCVDNQLDIWARRAVVIGAYSAFLFVELSERFVHCSRGQGALIQALNDIESEVLNCVLPGEHPAPLTRVRAALNQDTWRHDPERNFFLQVWDDVVEGFEGVWSLVQNGIEMQLQISGFQPNALIDRSFLFKPGSAVGCFDTRPLLFGGDQS